MRIAGFGCRAGTSIEALRKLLSQAEAIAGPVNGLATIPARQHDLSPLADLTALPLCLVNVTGITTKTNSPRIQSLHGTGSIAEAAALAACGPGGTITLPRITSPCGHATAAIAEGKSA